MHVALSLLWWNSNAFSVEGKGLLNVRGSKGPVILEPSEKYRGRLGILSLEHLVMLPPKPLSNLYTPG